MSLPENASFCLLPWMHQMVNNNGDLKLCCVAQGKVGEFTTMEADWNSPRMLEVRRAMVAGEMVADCAHCDSLERIGTPSFRMAASHQWGTAQVIDIVERSLENDYRVDAPPIYLDLRFGNLCNLMCKMCSPLNSSQISKDQVSLRKLDPEGFDRHLGAKHELPAYDWQDDPEVTAMLDRYIPHIQTLYLAGGEPTLSAGAMRFMTRCIELGYAHKITFILNTNVTNINMKFMESVAQFRHVRFICSMDGIGDTYEYIRVPAKWHRVEENMNTICQWVTAHPGKASICIATVLQTYNVLDAPATLDRLIRFATDHGLSSVRGLQVEVIPLIGPSTMCVKNLPDTIKAVARQRIVDWIEANPHQEPWLYQGFEPLRSVVALLDQPFKKSRFRDMLDYSRFVDQNKKVKFETSLPELHRMVTNYLLDESAKTG